jgi:alkylation response protein AidB-like acyl-CoA dehydrogenase
MTLAPDLHVLDESDSPLTFEELRAAGYLLLAVPVELGGLGGNLQQVCDQQRRLARRAPDLAKDTTTHHAWCGAAAERWRAGDSFPRWALEAALSGHLVLPAGQARDGLQEAWYQALSMSVDLGATDRRRPA